MAALTVSIPASLLSALEEEARRRKSDVSSFVTEVLAQRLDEPLHTIFQISISGALVAGVYSGVVSVRTLLRHGDFGLGTFAGLDGEMVVLDGAAYRVRGDGGVCVASPEDRAPFAVVTRFEPDVDAEVWSVTGFKDLEATGDRFRSSGNIFYAFRLDGLFSRVRCRAVNPPAAGTRLIDATRAQSEFFFSDVNGTLVGIWSPGFSSAFSVAGYHFHFLSDQRDRGGHVLDCAAERLRLRMEALSDFHLILPETESYLKADLSRNTAGELAYAEQAH